MHPIMLCCPCVQLQPSHTQPHHLDGFEVLYRSLFPASSDWAAQRVGVPRLQAVIGPLKRGYKYELKVRPYAGGLYGRESNTKHLRVPELGEHHQYVSCVSDTGSLIIDTHQPSRLALCGLQMMHAHHVHRLRNDFHL